MIALHSRWLRNVVLATVSLFVGCASARAGNELALTPEQISSLAIDVGDVRVATKRIVTTLPATIVPPVNTRIAITAPFSGTVLTAQVLPGQSIRTGDVLVTLASRDLFETVIRLKQAEADLQAAEVLARRQRELFQKNLVSLNKVGEAEAQVDKINATVNESRRLLTMGNIKINADGSYALTAPKDGRIVEVKATPGAALQAMDAALVIDTSRELWLQAQLPARLVGTVAVGDGVELQNGGSGKVISVGISLDPLTRSTTLVAEIPASPLYLTGQATSIAIVKSPARDEFEISAEAIAWIGGTAHVFVQTAGGFTPVPVTVRGRTAAIATIEGDLRPGQKLAVSGLAQLEKIMGGE
jgi:cobalt-zinc-cadmium efflux system membrane fusion protein